MRLFGDIVREMRIEKEITLRDFCRSLGLDPSNWSKIELNKANPPKSRELLESVCLELGLEASSDEYCQIFDSALIGNVPIEILGDTDILDKLPLFFRTARGNKLSESELKGLIKFLKE